MARLKDRTSAADNTAEDFLGSDFLAIMTGYAAKAGTSNPATDAAAKLRGGEAVLIPGDWIDPATWGGLVLQVQRGKPVAVVGNDG